MAKGVLDVIEFPGERTVKSVDSFTTHGFSDATPRSPDRLWSVGESTGEKSLSPHRGRPARAGDDPAPCVSRTPSNTLMSGRVIRESVRVPETAPSMEILRRTDSQATETSKW